MSNKTLERGKILFLTGRSGSGKSSLLNAYVLPRLQEASPPFHTLVVRSFHDPIEALFKSLLKSGAVWKSPPATETDARELLVNACAYLKGKRLLVVFDQFEEFLILHEADRRAALEDLLQSLNDNPISGLAVLLVARSDYIGQMQGLSLPSMNSHVNWKDISPFTEPISRDFLSKSGLQIGPGSMDQVIQEASELEETKGLIRPITLNMMGIVLSRLAPASRAELPKGRRAGELVKGYLRDSINQAEIRDHAPVILRPMVTSAGTKEPTTVQELAEKTRINANAVTGCLLKLGNDGIVRRLDDKENLWEISHDFVARLLGQIVARWRLSLARRVLPWTAPTALVLWAVTFFVVVPWVQFSQAVKDLSKVGGTVRKGTEGYLVRFTSTSRNLPLEYLGRALRRIGDIQSLNLSRTPVSDLKHIADLKNLQSLNLYNTQVSDLKPIAGLKNLKSLDLRLTNVWNSEVDALEKALPSLKIRR